MGGIQLPQGVQLKQLTVSPVEAAQMQAAQSTSLYIEIQLRLLDGWTWEEVKKDLGLNIPPRPNVALEAARAEFEREAGD